MHFIKLMSRCATRSIRPDGSITIREIRRPIYPAILRGELQILGLLYPIDIDTERGVDAASARGVGDAVAQVNRVGLLRQRELDILPPCQLHSLVIYSIKSHA